MIPYLSIDFWNHVSLRPPRVGSAPALSVSRFSQRLLTLRLARLQIALSNLLSRQLRRVGYPSRRDDSYRGGSTVPRTGLAPVGLTQLHDARRVERWRGGGTGRAKSSRTFRIVRLPRSLPSAPFPPPAHRTGRALLTHPALGLEFTSGIRTSRCQNDRKADQSVLAVQHLVREPSRSSP
jgi:hypothetical protein